MKYAILVLFVLTTINLFAQERLTIVEGLGTSERNVLKEIDGVSNLDADEFILYPNPSSGDVFIESSHKIESIRIHDLMGAQVKEVGSSTFSVSELTSGIYLLNIRIESGQEAIKKIVVY